MKLDFRRSSARIAGASERAEVPEFELTSAGETSGSDTPCKKVTQRGRKRALETSTPSRKRAKISEITTTSSRAHTVASFSSTPGKKNSGEDEGVWEQTSLVVRMSPVGGKTGVILRSWSNLPTTPRHLLIGAINTPPSTTIDSIQSSAIGRIASTLYESQHDVGGVAQRTVAPFERNWKDETRNFNMKHVTNSLHPREKAVSKLAFNLHWFPDAVPVNALFPPGVPMSAKEILAYYPHHVRWKGAIFRLVNNDYRSSEILAIQSWFRDLDASHPISVGQMNNFTRDTLRRTIPTFRTGGEAYKGKPDRNLYTDHLRPGRYIQDMCGGYVAPTFDELLEGLKYLPAGLEARGLTQCLVWYLNFRDMFTPRLEFNVLHTQSLIRALRMPLRPHGTRNLDKVALEEWKEAGKFAEKKVEDEARKYTPAGGGAEGLKKFRLELFPHNGTVKAYPLVKISAVLRFPSLALFCMAHGAVRYVEIKAELHEEERLRCEGGDGGGGEGCIVTPSSSSRAMHEKSRAGL